MSGVPPPWVGPAVVGLNGAGLLVLAAVLELRGQRRLPMTGLDVGLCFGAMLWLGALVSMVLIFTMTGTWVPAGDPPFVASLGGTMVGGVVAGGLGLRRAGREIGVGRLAASDWGWALGSVVVFFGLSIGWVAALEALGFQVSEQGLMQLLRSDGAGAWAVPAFVYAAVGAPIIEELMFRGMLQPVLSKAVGAGRAIVAQGLLFGVMHLADPVSVPPLILFGIALGWVRHRSGGLAAPVLAHVANNMLALAAAFLWG